MRGLVLAALASVLPARRARADGASATLTYAIASDVDTLDPDWAYDAASRFVDRQIYETLVDYDGGSADRFVPRLATVVPSVENGFLSRDGLTYRFPLRAGVKFHDGATMTPEDVRYSILRFLLLDRDGGPSDLLLRPLLGRDSVAGPDGRPDPAAYEEAARAVSIEGGALVLRLKAPFSPLLAVLASYAPVVSRARVAAHGGWDGSESSWAEHWNPSKERSALFADADGTGPFRLLAWDRAGGVVALVRFDGYWRAPAPLSAVRIESVPDPRARRRLLAAGDADAVWIDAGEAAGYRGMPGVEVDEDLPRLETADAILLNLRAAPSGNPWLGSGRLDGEGVPPDLFADRDVRRALALDFDDAALIRDGFAGKAVPANGPIPRGLPGWDGARGWTLSPERAAELLRRARGGALWSEGFLLPVACPTGRSGALAACRTLAAGLAALNPKFRVDCRELPQSRLLDELRARRPAALIASWALDYPDPYNAVQPFLGSSGFFAAPLGYSSARADALIADAEAATDPAKRRADYRELQALAVSDVPALFTVETNGALARSLKVRNWVRNPMLPYGSLYEVTKLP